MLEIDSIIFLKSSLQSFQNNTLYIGEYKHLPDQIDKTIPLLLLDSAPQEFIEKQENVALAKTNDILFLYQAIHDLFYKEVHIHNKLAQIFSLTINKVGNLQEILNTSAKLLGNPILIFDDTFRLIGNSDAFMIKDPVWEQHVKNGKTSEHFIKACNFSTRNNYLCQQRHDAYIGECSSSNLPWLICNIFRNQRVIGYLLMFCTESPISLIHFNILPVIRDCITLVLEKNQAFGVNMNYRSLHEKMLSELMETPNCNMQEIKARYEVLDVKFGNKLCTLAIKVPNGKNPSYICRLLHNDLQTCFPKAHTLNMTDNIMAVLSTCNYFLSKSEIEWLQKLAQQYGLYIGISNSYTDISLLAHSYKQACVAMGKAVNDQTGPNIYLYMYLSFQDLLSNYTDKDQLLNYCHPALAFLIDYMRLWLSL